MVVRKAGGLVAGVQFSAARQAQHFYNVVDIFWIWGVVL